MSCRAGNLHAKLHEHQAGVALRRCSSWIHRCTRHTPSMHTPSTVLRAINKENDGSWYKT